MRLESSCIKMYTQTEKNDESKKMGREVKGRVAKEVHVLLSR